MCASTEVALYLPHLIQIGLLLFEVFILYFKEKKTRRYTSALSYVIFVVFN
jgi:hypothetical protein